MVNLYIYAHPPNELRGYGSLLEPPGTLIIGKGPASVVAFPHYKEPYLYSSLPIIDPTKAPSRPAAIVRANSNNPHRLKGAK